MGSEEQERRQADEGPREGGGREEKYRGSGLALGER